MKDSWKLWVPETGDLLLIRQPSGPSLPKELRPPRRPPVELFPGVTVNNLVELRSSSKTQEAKMFKGPSGARHTKVAV